MAQLLRLARRADVGLYRLAPFYCDHPPQDGLMLGYGAIDTLDIDQALLRLRDILATLDPPSTEPAPPQAGAR